MEDGPSGGLALRPQRTLGARHCIQDLWERVREGVHTSWALERSGQGILCGSRQVACPLWVLSFSVQKASADACMWL